MKEFLILCIFILGQTKAQDVNNLVKILHSQMKPFGCLDIGKMEGLEEEMEGMKECAGKVFLEFLYDGNDQKKKPDLGKMLSSFTQCKYETYHMLDDDGQLSAEKINKLYKEFLDDLEGGLEEDKQFMKYIANDCASAIEGSGIPVPQSLHAYEMCIIGKIIDKCRDDPKRKEEIGVLLPVIYGISTLGMSNSNCDDVALDPTMISSFDQCVAEEKEKQKESKEKNISFTRGRLLSNIVRMLKTVSQIPELTCYKIVGEQYNFLTKDGIANYTAIADAVNKFQGFINNDTRDEVVNLINRCDNENKDEETEELRRIKVLICFLPKYTNTCGLNNKLTYDLLFPLVNPEVINSIFDKIKNHPSTAELVLRIMSGTM